MLGRDGEIADPSFTPQPDQGRFAAGARSRHQADAPGICQGGQTPRRRVHLENRQAGKLVHRRVEEVVVIDGAGVAEDPAAIEHAERLHRPTADRRVQPLRFAVRNGEHVFLHLEQHAAADRGKQHHRGGRPIEADAAGPHHDELAVPGQEADRDERCHESRERDDVVDVLRRLPVEVPQQQARRGGAAKQLVGDRDRARQTSETEEATALCRRAAQRRSQHVRIRDRRSAEGVSLRPGPSEAINDGGASAGS